MDPMATGPNLQEAATDIPAPSELADAIPEGWGVPAVGGEAGDPGHIQQQQELQRLQLLVERQQRELMLRDQQWQQQQQQQVFHRDPPALSFMLTTHSVFWKYN
jgi:hypothetical protein